VYFIIVVFRLTVSWTVNPPAKVKLIWLRISRRKHKRHWRFIDIVSRSECQMRGWLTNNKLEDGRKEAVVSVFAVRFQRSLGGGGLGRTTRIHCRDCQSQNFKPHCPLRRWNDTDCTVIFESFLTHTQCMIVGRPPHFRQKYHFLHQDDGIMC
jgi:hypothetical protein